VSDLARAFLDELAADPVALDRLRELLAGSVERDPAVPELLSLKDAGKMLRRHPKTVGRWIDNGLIRAVIVNDKRKIRADDLREDVERLDRAGSPSSSRSRSPRRRRTRATSGRFDFLRQ
jgi:hypothetical protein